MPEPTVAELAALDTLYRTTRVPRRRTRAQIVLLALERRLAAPAIAAIVREHEETVRRWLKRDRAEGREGLKDRPMPGAPTKTDAADVGALVAAVRRRPRSLGQPFSLRALRRLADHLAEQAGGRASCETVRRILADAGSALSRPQHTVSSPDPEYQGEKRRSRAPATSSPPATPSTLPTSATCAGCRRCARCGARGGSRS
jgi:transposase